ncbi:MAG TPA: LptA/OstA family protein [Parvularculaceae bacterium]|nr:LptA/OstA family protein [Parvularculaceae bacterium]
MRGKYPLAIAAALAAAASPAAAQLVADADQPVDITGDSLEIVNKIATWTGNVRAVQGDAILTAKKLVATLGENGGFTTIQAVGEVRYSNGKEAIAGDTAVYDAVARSITVSQNVIVTQGETVMTGGAIVYWLDTGRIRFTAPQGSRIRGIFHTKSASSPL